MESLKFILIGIVIFFQIGWINGVGEFRIPNVIDYGAQGHKILADLTTVIDNTIGSCSGAGGTVLTLTAVGQIKLYDRTYGTVLGNEHPVLLSDLSIDFCDNTLFYGSKAMNGKTEDNNICQTIWTNVEKKVEDTCYMWSIKDRYVLFSAFTDINGNRPRFYFQISGGNLSVNCKKGTGTGAVRAPGDPKAHQCKLNVKEPFQDYLED